MIEDPNMKICERGINQSIWMKGDVCAELTRVARIASSRVNILMIYLFFSRMKKKITLPFSDNMPRNQKSFHSYTIDHNNAMT